MKINLVDMMPCHFGADRFSVIQGLDIKPSTDLNCDKLFCFKLCERLESIMGCSIKDSCMIITLSANGQDDSTLMVSLQDTFHILKTLKSMLSDELLVGMSIHFNFEGDNAKQVSIISNDMPVNERCICYDTSVVSSRRINEGLLRTRIFEAHLSIYIITSSSYPRSKIPQKPNIYKSILDQGICHDAVIVVQNGAELRCNKCFLIAHSDVFARMFKRTDTKEKRSSVVSMPDLSEESGRAFLEFLYYGNDALPDDNSAIAWELLFVGHKYDITSLESAMTNMLISKPIIWFDVDVAVKLFLFADCLPQGDDLTLKAATVLGLNSYERKRSPTFKRLPVSEKVKLLNWTLKASDMYFGSWEITESNAEDPEDVPTEPIPTTSSNSST